MATKAKQERKLPTFDDTYKLLERFQNAFNERCEDINITTASENISLLNSAMIILQRMFEHQYATNRIVHRDAESVVEALSKFTYLEPEWK